MGRSKAAGSVTGKASVWFVPVTRLGPPTGFTRVTSLILCKQEIGILNICSIFSLITLEFTFVRLSFLAEMGAEAVFSKCSLRAGKRCYGCNHLKVVDLACQFE